MVKVVMRVIGNLSKEISLLKASHYGSFGNGFNVAFIDI